VTDGQWAAIINDHCAKSRAKLVARNCPSSRIRRMRDELAFDLESEILDNPETAKDVSVSCGDPLVEQLGVALSKWAISRWTVSPARKKI
jgi:hypothetical protein